ncbi:hypothetical protein J3R30DRAFT_3715103 [Lentinula aciculospora]|uniref:Uncharacterized protein n=1 Tax=Lentinula aciculospora TaxID=153920 RepID=A0A9W8ZXD8_9AGAR|nr:hypothetical protein J3R30DRAFT_3715103 [Lentinula aciculospora]
MSDSLIFDNEHYYSSAVNQVGRPKSPLHGHRYPTTAGSDYDNLGSVNADQSLMILTFIFIRATLLDNFMFNTPLSMPTRMQTVSNTSSQQFPFITKRVLTFRPSSQASPVASDHAPLVGSGSTLSNRTRISSFSPTTNENGAVTLGKRSLPADLDQTALAVSRNIKLKPDSEKELKKFVSLSEGKQHVWLGGWLLQLQEKCNGIDPPDSTYNIPKKLQVAIKAAVIKTLLDPGLPGYLTAMAKFTAYLTADASCDYPSIKDDSTKNNVVISITIPHACPILMISLKMQVSFVSEKKAEPDSVLQLGEVIINKLGASAGTKVTLALAAHIAFLRKIYVDNCDEKGVCDDSF